MKLSDIEMSYTWTTACRKIHKNVRYWNVVYTNYSRYIYETVMLYTWTTAGKYM